MRLGVRVCCVQRRMPSLPAEYVPDPSRGPSKDPLPYASLELADVPA